MPVGKSQKSRSGRSQHSRTTSSRRRSSSRSSIEQKQTVFQRSQRSTGKSSSRREPSFKRSGRHSRSGRSRQSQHSSRRKHTKSKSDLALPTPRTGGLSPPKQRQYIPIRSKQTSRKEARSSTRSNREPERTRSTTSRRSVRTDGKKRPPETSKEDEDSSDLDYSDFDDTQWENTVWKERHLRVKRGLLPESSNSKSVTNPKENHDVEAGDVGTDVPGEARQTIVERGAHHLKRPITTLALLIFEGVIALSAVAVMLIEGYAVYGQIATLMNMLTVTILVGLLTRLIFHRSHIETSDDEQGTTCRVKLVWKSLVRSVLHVALSYDDLQLLVTHLLRLGLTLTSVAIELYYAACGDASFVTRRCDVHQRFFYPAASLLTLTAALQGFHLFYAFFRRRFVVRRPCRD